MTYAVIYLISFVVCLYAAYMDANEGCIRTGADLLLAFALALIPGVNTFAAVIFLVLFYYEWHTFRGWKKNNEKE